MNRSTYKYILIATSLSLGCGSEDPQFDLGYEHGCEWGTEDGLNCVDSDGAMDQLNEEDSDYAAGFLQGYEECYETVWIARDCDNQGPSEPDGDAE